MDSEALLVRRKIIGVLIRAAREKSHRTVQQVAQRLGVTAARVRQYENGARDVTLPELELLALFFEMPLSYFLDASSLVQEESPFPPTQEEIRKRKIALGAKLKQARVAAGKSKEECAELLGCKPGTIARYERGLGDVSVTLLELLAEFLGVKLFYFVEDTKTVERGGVLDLEKLARLPKDVRGFVLDPSNLAYLRMAIKFGDLPTNKLKELGEILLVVH
ncbi:MAG: helix-turn-helix transcriptional regulator [Chloroflexi bacterium]|nr:helix-turn-helix transcriptional regulator [Chloroflexota bacterium]